MLIRLLVVLLLHLSAAELLTVSHDLVGLLGAGHGLGLHVDGDDERGEGVASHDAAIVHDVLGRNFTTFKNQGV
jgi:hypothetical protein